MTLSDLWFQGRSIFRNQIMSKTVQDRAKVVYDLSNVGISIILPVFEDHSEYFTTVHLSNCR